MFHTLRFYTAPTGVDLPKILWATKILGGQKVSRTDKIIGVSQLLRGTCPGCPPKSMAMTVSHQWKAD